MYYITSRPLLSKELQRKGYSAKEISHPGDPRPGWLFDLDARGVEFISGWLSERGFEIHFPRQGYVNQFLKKKKSKKADRANKITAQQIAERFLPEKMNGGRCECLACGCVDGIEFFSNGKFLCKRCGASGTAIGFVMLTGINAKDATKLICDEFGV